VVQSGQVVSLIPKGPALVILGAETFEFIFEPFPGVSDLFACRLGD
jgi:hypothetical protein